MWKIMPKKPQFKPVATPVEGQALQLQLVEVKAPDGPLLIPYEVRRSRRSRSIRLTLGYHNQALLTVPYFCPQKHAIDFLRSQGAWLQKALETAPPSTTLLRFLLRRPWLSALGDSFKLMMSFTTGRPFMVTSAKTREAVFKINAGEAGEAQLRTHLRDFAGEMLVERTRQLAAMVGARVGRVTVRDQCTRWGSCSSNRTISLNWRLILLKPDLQDYVILHELAHLTEMNHSLRFWRLLQRYDSLAIKHDREITRQAIRIMSLGR